jgi:hypothetical protein
MSGIGVLVLTLCTTTSCVTAGGGTQGQRNRSQITAEEIATTNASSAYEIVERLRPEFLRSRGQKSLSDPTPDDPIVYVNGMRSGAIESMRSMSAQDVLEIRFITAADATTRFGTGHTGGVIEVRTRRSPTHTVQLTP